MGIAVLPDGTLWAAGPDGLFQPGRLGAIPLPADAVDMSMGADPAGQLQILGIRRWWAIEGDQLVDRGPAPCEGVGSARVAGAYVLCDDRVVRRAGST